jgi:hypothetical protein
MFVHGFDSYRIFISAPGDLEREREACRAAISEVNAEEAMPSKVLLVSVGLRDDSAIDGFRSAIAQNIRQCTYHIQVFQDDWGPNNLFRKMFTVALESRDDSAMPMREVIVCLKAAPGETDAQILAFRKELEERSDLRVYQFEKADDLTRIIHGVSTEWTRSIIAAGGGVPQNVAG